MQPITFLDIDGVVLTGNAWRQPENSEALALMKRRVNVNQRPITPTTGRG
jgi:hypothetical protein